MIKSSKSRITTHILDTSLGRPASSVSVTLEVQSSNHRWTQLSSEKTNSEGRIDFFAGLPPQLEVGLYRLHFETEAYFKALHVETFYPNVLVTFKVLSSEKHYHVPLLVNPFGYSTYRGT